MYFLCVDVKVEFLLHPVSQVPLPSAVQATPSSSSTLVTPPTAQPVGGAAKPAAEKAKPKEAKKKTKEGNAEKPKKGGGGGAAVVDVSRLDFRVGRIVRAWKHPDADTLYCEEGGRGLFSAARLSLVAVCL